LKTHLIGVLNHGREAVGYFDLMQWPHDSNRTINIVMRVLLRMDIVSFQTDCIYKWTTAGEKTRISMFWHFFVL
jgi:hypothetical protein